MNDRPARAGEPGVNLPPASAPIAERVKVVDDLGDCGACGEYMGHEAILIRKKLNEDQASYDWGCPHCMSRKGKA